MKCDILLDILFDLLTKRKVTARDLANKYECSERTIYRYVDVLSIPVPIQIQRGRNGGICISDTYKLPVGFMKKEEYDAAIEALEITYGQMQDERYLKAKRKLSAQQKTEQRDLALSGNLGTLLVDSSGWGDTRKFYEKIRLFEECVHQSFVVEIEYNSRMGEVSNRKIEPHLLLLKQGVWYVFAFCRKQREFRLFRLGRIVYATKLEERFNRKPVQREQIPLQYWTDKQNEEIKLEIHEHGFADALDWLGRESLKEVNGKWLAEVSLPNDEVLVKKIVSFGKDITVLSPDSLKEKVKTVAMELLKNY
jgi:predicted DNA-binding transcriptional regulator YafY